MPEARFVCLSDVDVPCDRVAIEKGWPGWWSKVEMFRHFKGRTLYLDLDTVLIANPEHLVTGEFLMIRNWCHQELFASGVMSWDGDYSHITDAFEQVASEVMDGYVTERQWGDQAFIAEKAGAVSGFPSGAIASYRYQLLGKKRIPPAVRIVAFNGTHLPWAGPDWARHWWQ